MVTFQGNVKHRDVEDSLKALKRYERLSKCNFETGGWECSSVHSNLDYTIRSLIEPFCWKNVHGLTVTLRVYRESNTWFDNRRSRPTRPVYRSWTDLYTSPRFRRDSRTIEDHNFSCSTEGVLWESQDGNEGRLMFPRSSYIPRKSIIHLGGNYASIIHDRLYLHCANSEIQIYENT